MKEQVQIKLNVITATLVPLILLLFNTHVKASLMADLSGQWTGTMEAGSRPGTVDLTLSRDSTGWSAAVKVNWNGMDFANPVNALGVTDDAVSFTTEIAGASARFTGKFVEQKITGTIEATLNGRVVGTGVWTVTRSAPLAPSSGSPPGPGADSMPNRMIGEVAAIDLTVGQLSLKLDGGGVVIVKFSPQTSCLRIPPDQKTIEKAERISSQLIGIGDRLFASGQISGDRTFVSARQLIVMAKADLAEQQERDRADWHRRGITGTVTALNPNTKEITLRQHLPAGGHPVTVIAADGVLSRRYTPDSVKFSDAKPASLSDLRIGDQLWARGEKSADGLRFTPEEIVFGTFRTIGGTVISIDAETREVKIQDVQSPQSITVFINQSSLLRRLPPDLATQLTKRVRAARSQPSAPATQSAHEQDWQGTIERLPPLTVNELKPGDRLIVVGARGAQSSRVTAISLYLGADALVKLLQEQQTAQRSNGQIINLGLPNSVIDGPGRP